VLLVGLTCPISMTMADLAVGAGNSLGSFDAAYGGTKSVDSYTARTILIEPFHRLYSYQAEPRIVLNISRFGLTEQNLPRQTFLLFHSR
jgi:hypothetical protein